MPRFLFISIGYVFFEKKAQDLLLTAVKVVTVELKQILWLLVKIT